MPEDSLPEECSTFQKWHEDNQKIRSNIFVSISNDIQKQYDRLDDFSSIMLCMSDVYVVPDRYIGSAVTKVFFETMLTEGSSLQSHGVKKLSLMEKLEVLKIGLENDTYIGVILQLLPRSYDLFVVNYNMNGLEKSVYKLINMLVPYKATSHKSGPSVLIGEASTFKANSKRVGRWKRKKGKGKAVATIAHTPSTPVALAEMSKGKGKAWGSQQSMAYDVCMHCQGKGQ
ncbi:UNVERIFIED_CONTAM: hypothetical protein Sradi_3179800 [Sesamum radiatum]|uniref:Uncharacterized protein n=1 Tax=Sesamum radiatum TaxID=300843 RepID=A0AAW2RFX1_SESRA